MRCGYRALTSMKPNTKLDLHLTDVGLPGDMSGRQLADAARVARPPLSTICHWLRGIRDPKSRSSRERYAGSGQAIFRGRACTTGE